MLLCEERSDHGVCTTRQSRRRCAKWMPATTPFHPVQTTSSSQRGDALVAISSCSRRLLWITPQSPARSKTLFDIRCRHFSLVVLLLVIDTRCTVHISGRDARVRRRRERARLRWRLGNAVQAGHMRARSEGQREAPVAGYRKGVSAQAAVCVGFFPRSAARLCVEFSPRSVLSFPAGTLNFLCSPGFAGAASTGRRTLDYPDQNVLGRL
jgi:hypothetical protein